MREYDCQGYVNTGTGGDSPSFVLFRKMFYLISLAFQKDEARRIQIEGQETCLRKSYPIDISIILNILAIYMTLIKCICTSFYGINFEKRSQPQPHLLVKNHPTQFIFSAMSEIGDDVSSVSSWSLVSGELRDSSTRENSINVSPQVSYHSLLIFVEV